MQVESNGALFKRSARVKGSSVVMATDIYIDLDVVCGVGREAGGEGQNSNHNSPFQQ